MFLLIRLIITLAGLALIGTFVLNYFGYQVNWNYFKERQSVCQERLKECQMNLLKTGIEGAKETCDFECVDPKLLIRKEAEGE